MISTITHEKVREIINKRLEAYQKVDRENGILFSITCGEAVGAILFAMELDGFPADEIASFSDRFRGINALHRIAVS